MVRELEQQIAEDHQRVYSAKVLHEASNPKNMGPMKEATVHAGIRGWCGDSMEIFLRIRGETIEQITFITDGCGSAVACGSMITSMVEGKTIEQATSITPKELLVALDGLPKESVHCADLAVNTLKEAIRIWRSGDKS